MKAPSGNHSIILCAACVALLLLACDRAKPVETAHPLLKVEVIGVPSGGTTVSASGPVSIKKNQSSEYVPMSPDYIIGAGDLIQLRKGGSLEIRFTNGTIAVMEAGSADRWIRFQ